MANLFKIVKTAHITQRLWNTAKWVFALSNLIALGKKIFILNKNCKVLLKLITKNQICWC